MHLPLQSHQWAVDVLSLRTRANLQSEDSHQLDRLLKMSHREAQARVKDTTLRAMKSSRTKWGNLMPRSTLAVRSIWMHKIAHLTSQQIQVLHLHRRHNRWLSKRKWFCLKSCKRKLKMRSGRQTTRTWAHSQKVCLLKLFWSLATSKALCQEKTNSQIACGRSCSQGVAWQFQTQSLTISCSSLRTKWHSQCHSWHQLWVSTSTRCTQSNCRSTLISSPCHPHRCQTIWRLITKQIIKIRTWAKWRRLTHTWHT